MRLSTYEIFLHLINGKEEDAGGGESGSSHANE